MPVRVKNRAAQAVKRFQALKTTTRILILLMTIASVVMVAFVFRRIASYELHHAYNWDSPLYWTVGRGMLNGLKPYTDLFENKPLGMFLISAFSFRLTDDTIICNIIGVLSVLLIALLPAAVLMVDRWRKVDTDTAAIRYVLSTFLVLLIGLLFAIYSEKRAGGFQSEAIGAACSILFICLVKTRRLVTTRRSHILLSLGSALAIGCAVMVKEPFLLISVFGALLFVDCVKDFFRYIILPSVIGGSLVAGILIAFGAFVPYFTVYIRSIFTERVTGMTSVIRRSLNILRLFKDIRKTSIVLLAMVLMFLFLAFLYAFKTRKSTARFIINAVKIPVAVYVASFCVSIGGQYFNHHFIFAVPIYSAVVIYGSAFLYEYIPDAAAPNRSILILILLLTVAVTLKTGTSYRSYYENISSLKAKAQYVDTLLDHYQADRYQFIGFNDDEKFYGLTKHSPQGPVFVQDPIYFSDKPTWFSRSLSEQLEDCDVIILDQYPSREIRRCVHNTIMTDFTFFPFEKLGVTPPDDFECDIYLRTSKYG